MKRDAKIKKIKALAKDCMEIDSMVLSIKNMKHKIKVVPYLAGIKAEVFEEMEKLVDEPEENTAVE
jgi:hypothetical protein